MRQMTENFKLMQPIKKLNYWVVLFCNRTKYKKLLVKSQSSLKKELDLRKFVHRQRVTMTAILGLLSGRQSFYVDKMS